MLIVNHVIINIRLEEIKQYLHETDNDEGGIDHISLIATYELHKKLYEKRISPDQADAIDSRIRFLSVSAGTKRSMGVPALFEVPALYMINFNRFVLGKHPAAYRNSGTTQLSAIDRGYYYERNLMFQRAIDEYRQALGEGALPSSLKASLLLRQGYCFALTGNNDSAVINYRRVISEFGEESSAVTASILIRYLEGFTIERERAIAGGADPLTKSQMLVNLLAYKKALEIIEQVEKKTSRSDMPRMLYYKARCYSGLGEPGRAAESYIRVVNTAPSSPYARFSNRRLYMIGAFAGGDNSILKKAVENNKMLKDPVFDEIVRTRNENSISLDLPEERIAVELPASDRTGFGRQASDQPRGKVKFLVIITNDGNTFRGKLIKKTGSVISIQTTIGRIDVKREKIKNVTEE